MSKIKYSIIIPVKAINNYIKETIPHIQKIKSNNWELIIIPNQNDYNKTATKTATISKTAEIEIAESFKTEINQWKKDKRIKFIYSSPVGPAKKRDQAAEVANGEILLFLDDDSFPDPNFFRYS